jgi:large subunit ribosomal protein L25
MANQFELTAEVRSDLGKGASRRLRSTDKVPAIMYGAGKPPIALTLNHNHVTKALENEAFYSHILTIEVSGEKQQAVLKDLQRHPFKPKITHMDFLRINPKEKLTMQIPLHFKGGENAPGVKLGGIIMHLANSVEIRCLPADLPEYIDVDISQLGLDEPIHLSQLKLPKGTELTAFLHGHAEEHDEGVVKIQLPRAAEETPTAEATPATGAPAAVATAAQPTKADAKKETKK